MRFVRLVTRRLPALGAVAGVLVVACIAVSGGQARAAAPAQAPLAGSASATLAQVNAVEWTTTVYLDTAALCTGKNPAGNKFTLVTGKPSSVTGAAAPAYPDGPLECGATAANPVTQVKLTFAPSPALRAVPQTATLVVIPPPAPLLAGDAPVQVPLTVRRTVSPWQYVGIPAVCGATLAVLLVLLLMALGMPGRDVGQPAAAADQGTGEQETVPGQHGPGQHGPGQHGTESSGPGQSGPVPVGGQLDFSARLVLFLMAKRPDLLVTEFPGAGGNGGPGGNGEASRNGGTDGNGGASRNGGTVGNGGTGPDGGAAAKPVAGGAVAAAALARGGTDGAGTDGAGAAGAGPKRKRVRWGLEFWRTPLFAGAAWSFGDSWATSVTPLTALAGGVLTASGAVAGLVPGVDLTRFGLLMALVGGLTTLAPLLFGAVNSLFPAKDAADPAPAGEVVAARLWVMLLASCLTVFAIGAEIGFVGLVLGFDLLVVSPSVRWIGPAATALAAVLFLAYGAHSILTLVGQPSGMPKKTARKHSFMM